MRVGVITFPGSNCDDDCVAVFRDVLRQDVVSLWHDDQKLPKLDLILLPGGFSYGDYLRAGAIARFSHLMTKVKTYVRARQGYVLGICNGFQILVEAGLLPGTLMRNEQLKFACQDVKLRVENNETALTSLCLPGQVLTMPIAHGDGNYFVTPEELSELEAHGQIIFRYVNGVGEPSRSANPNGSVGNIAGVCDTSRHVFGMMPHPERAAESILRSDDGRILLESLLH